MDRAFYQKQLLQNTFSKCKIVVYECNVLGEMDEMCM